MQAIPTSENFQARASSPLNHKTRALVEHLADGSCLLDLDGEAHRDSIVFSFMGLSGRPPEPVPWQSHTNAAVYLVDIDGTKDELLTGQRSAKSFQDELFRVTDSVAVEDVLFNPWLGLCALFACDAAGQRFPTASLDAKPTEEDFQFFELAFPEAERYLTLVRMLFAGPPECHANYGRKIISVSDGTHLSIGAPPSFGSMYLDPHRFDLLPYR